jgi:pSer/pThr/pTyr-binding forkhead associated (FHA) protein
MARVRVTVNGKVEQELDVDREIVVGRKPPADVVIADGQVSSRHARLRPSGDGIVVADLGSTNGTRIDDGDRLPPDRDVPLGKGRKLVIGPAVLEVIEAQKLDSDSGFGRVGQTVVVRGDQLQSTLVNIARFKAARARLVVAAEHVKKSMPIDDMEVVIGREAPPAQLAVQHQSVSSKHANLKFADGRFILSDLGSSNGTFVEGVRISGPTPLDLQTAVTLGTVDCLFVQRPPEAGGSAGGADPHADMLCLHAERTGKATQQQVREILAEHRKDGRTLGELFVERGIFSPKEWSDLYRQREMLATLGAVAARGGGRSSLARTIGIVVAVVGLAALLLFAAKGLGVFSK